MIIHQDMLVLEKMDDSVFCADTIRSYRNVMKLARPTHIWTNLDDGDFLYRIGEGTVTDPRNSLLMKFFNLINVGERSGRGVYEIFQVWAGMGWDAPALSEVLDFDRTSLTLPITKAAIKRDDKKETIKTKRQKDSILLYMKDNRSITTSDAATLLHVGITRAKTLLRQLEDAGMITAQGEYKNRRYVQRI